MVFNDKSGSSEASEKVFLKLASGVDSGVALTFCPFELLRRFFQIDK